MFFSISALSLFLFISIAMDASRLFAQCSKMDLKFGKVRKEDGGRERERAKIERLRLKDVLDSGPKSEPVRAMESLIERRLPICV